VTSSQGIRLRRRPLRRRGIWPTSPSLRPLAGGLFGWPRGFSGAAEHRRARGGQWGWHLHRHHGWSGPAAFAEPRPTQGCSPPVQLPSAAIGWAGEQSASRQRRKSHAILH